MNDRFASTIPYCLQSFIHSSTIARVKSDTLGQRTSGEPCCTGRVCKKLSTSDRPAPSLLRLQTTSTRQLQGRDKGRPAVAYT